MARAANETTRVVVVIAVKLAVMTALRGSGLRPTHAGSISLWLFELVAKPNACDQHHSKSMTPLVGRSCDQVAKPEQGWRHARTKYSGGGQVEGQNNFVGSSAPIHGHFAVSTYARTAQGVSRIERGEAVEGRPGKPVDFNDIARQAG
jgi:hypothetical protein